MAARPKGPPTITVLREWVQALMLFGRCNGTDWEVLMRVADETLGEGREHAPLGIAAFAARSTASKQSLADSLKRLTRPVAEGGYEMLTVVTDKTFQTERVLKLQTDWKRWAWTNGPHYERARLVLDAFELVSPPPPSRPAPDPVAPSTEAVLLAVMLRQGCLGIIPNAEVPNPDDPDDPDWMRWCRTMDNLLERGHDREDVQFAIEYAQQDKFWRRQVLTRAADKRLDRNFDTILVSAREAATPKERQRRGFE